MSYLLLPTTLARRTIKITISSRKARTETRIISPTLLVASDNTISILAEKKMLQNSQDQRVLFNNKQNHTNRPLYICGLAEPLIQFQLIKIQNTAQNQQIQKVKEACYSKII